MGFFFAVGVTLLELEAVEAVEAWEDEDVLVVAEPEPELGLVETFD